MRKTQTKGVFIRDPTCPPGSTCETGAGGLMYAESDDGFVWKHANVGIMWPPNATDPKEQTQSVSRAHSLD